jgi:hypothetical protein
MRIQKVKSALIKANHEDWLRDTFIQK